VKGNFALLKLPGADCVAATIVVSS
jgi:hypothetical protein